MPVELMTEQLRHWVCLIGWKNVLPTLHRPEHRVVVTVADSSWVCKTGSPQAGPVPGHLDDGGAPHAPNAGDLPALHGHGAGHENPAQNCHQETPDLDHTNLHLGASRESIYLDFRSRGDLAVGYFLKLLFLILNHSSTIQFSFLFGSPYSCRRRLHPELNVYFSSEFKSQWPAAPLLFPEKGEDECIAGTNQGCIVVFQVSQYMWVRDNSRSGSHGPQLNPDWECSPKHLSRITTPCPHQTFPHVQFKRRKICI